MRNEFKLKKHFGFQLSSVPLSVDPEISEGCNIQWPAWGYSTAFLGSS